MWDILLEPAKIFIKGGVDAFKKSDEIKNLTIAVQARIKREIRLNAAILEEVQKETGGTPKHNNEIKAALIKSLKTKAFDEINNGAFPLSLFFDKELNRDEWPNWKNKEKYLGYCKSDKIQLNLLERTYHRIYLATTFAECNHIPGDVEYIRFLLAALNSSIPRYESES